MIADYAPVAPLRRQAPEVLMHLVGRFVPVVRVEAHCSLLLHRDNPRDKRAISRNLADFQLVIWDVTSATVPPNGH